MNAKTESRKRIFMLMPFLLLIAAFIIDKQIPLWGLEAYFLRTASFVSYKHKDTMLEELDEYSSQADRKKILIIFGNSRSTTFDNEYIARTYPDWILFNFSVPGGTSDYYLYRMQQFAELGIKPDFVIFAVSPEGINGTPAVAMDEVLLEGLPPSFILKNFYNYRVDHITNFIAKKTFWGYQYRPKVGTIIDRLQNDSAGKKQFNKFIELESDALKKQRGSLAQANAAKQVQSDARLKQYAAGAFRDFLTPFKPSTGQLDFTERMLMLARGQQIPNAMVWIKVGPHLRTMQNTMPVTIEDNPPTTITDYFTREMQKLADQHGSSFLDMNSGKQQSITCDHYYDSSHIAAYCFPELTDYLFRAIKSNSL